MIQIEHKLAWIITLLNSISFCSDDDGDAYTMYN